MVPQVYGMVLLVQCYAQTAMALDFFGNGSGVMEF